MRIGLDREDLGVDMVMDQDLDRALGVMEGRWGIIRVSRRCAFSVGGERGSKTVWCPFLSLFYESLSLSLSLLSRGFAICGTAPFFYASPF